MNIYSVEFFSICPNNKIRIKYLLTIKTKDVIMVEYLLEFVATLTGFHEKIADKLKVKFKGSQKLTAFHHGVKIETIR